EEAYARSRFCNSRLPLRSAYCPGGLFALCPLRFILAPVSLLQIALMFIAAFFAGIVNSIAGGGMLLVFPMMIWLGVDPKIANATCTVALWPGLFGGL